MFIRLIIMPPSPDQFSTRELSGETWRDFERLFWKQGSVGDGWWCWCTFHHVSSFSTPEHQQPRTRAERAQRNHQKKEELVMSGCAHGILVYSNAEPVGWCQYGPREELPRVDNTIRYRKLALENDSEKLWRITCFVADSKYRRRGVASAGLKGALAAIKRRGGGVVEAYPVSKTDQGANYHCGRLSQCSRRPGLELLLLSRKVEPAPS